MSPLKHLTLFILFSFHLQAANESPPVDMALEQERLLQLQNYESDIMISHLYRRGSHLIYDCQGRHYACVSTEGFNRCAQKRAEDFEDKKMELRCTPFKQFDSLEECVAQQIELTTRLVKKDFCWNLSDDRLFKR